MLRVQIHSAAAKRPDDRDHYEGVVRFQHLDDPARGLRAIAVFFELGSRTKPHTHDGDQLLVCLSGEGVVAIEGAAERIVPHDTVWIPKGTWHWHGASTTSAMCHLTVMPKSTKSTWDGIESHDWPDYRHDGVVPFTR